MYKRKLKPFVIPTLGIIVVLSIFALTFFMTTTSNMKENINDTPSNVITDLPVIKESEVMINPYNAEQVSIGKNFYEKDGKEEEQEKSIVKYDDTYMQNCGIDYISDKAFDAISVLKGKVISVSEDETQGNTVKVEHENGYVSVYQSLEKVNVKKDDQVIQGQVIGTSGINKLDKELGNHIHFELYINGNMVNPTNYLNKPVNTTQTQE